MAPVSAGDCTKPILSRVDIVQKSEGVRLTLAPSRNRPLVREVHLNRLSTRLFYFFLFFQLRLLCPPSWGLSLSLPLPFDRVAPPPVLSLPVSRMPKWHEERFAFRAQSERSELPHDASNRHCHDVRIDSPCVSTTCHHKKFYGDLPQYEVPNTN